MVELWENKIMQWTNSIMLKTGPNTTKIKLGNQISAKLIDQFS